jgi:DNA-3-methyladenine glycosylase I
MADPDPRLDGRLRCGWAQNSAAEAAYHDTVWGTPQYDPTSLFEFLTLEGAQAGLSWRTILDRRAGYQHAFAGFDPIAVAAFTDDDVDRLMLDTGIIRNRGKITSTIGNARAWLEIDDPVTFLWSFVDGSPIVHHAGSTGLPASTDRSVAMSKALKRLGFRFVGPTICYALMQACGMVNDHWVECFRHPECAAQAGAH